jgi:hypothetical protein
MFSAGSTWPPLKRPRKSSISTPLAKAGELGEADTDGDGVMRLERSAVLALRGDEATAANGNANEG